GEVVGAVHITSDITEHRKANRALQESENKFRLAFANAQDAILWVDVESGVVTKCNKATEDLFGRKKKDIIGHHHTTLSPVGKAESFHSLLSGSGRDLDSNVETEILTKEGLAKTVTISLSAMSVDGKEIVQGIIRDITDSKRANEEISNLAKFPSEDPNPVLRISEDGKIMYANDASSSLLRTWRVQEGQLLPELWCRRIEEIAGSSGSETYEVECDDGRTFFLTLQPIVGSGYVNGYGLDITKRKKAENEKIELEVQLSQQQKMQAIGTLAGGIAHDFNNILAAMQGYLELSLDDLSDEIAVRDHLEKMVACVNRATKLVRQILTFSRKNEQEQEKEPVQISSIVREVHGMLRSSLPTTIKFKRKIQADASIVMANPTQLHQVLVNLCTNASRAMRNAGGVLEVILKDVDLKSETRVGDELLEPGPYVKITVTDTGCGMDKEVLERIFEPFFTTRNVDEGTGLGLSVVHGIIKSHNGAIAVSSTPGEGTTFEIFLPKIGSVEIQEPQSSGQLTRDKEVILLVDDEEVMVDVTRQILDRLGYEVIAKTNSVDALEAFQEEPGKFDLVITDQIMPNMTGTQLAEKLISIRPDISIILCSGFPENVTPEQLESIGIKEFILKPVTRQEIAKIIRRELDKNTVTT
ncbi:MAG: ATP-binding protein, partial [Planctomycetota bacterium]